MSPQAALDAARAAAQEPVKKAKEKPKTKTPIPGTPWLRVITTAGNVFYTNKDKKESVWTVPDEIKDAVAKLDEEESAREEEERRMLVEVEEKKAEREVEVERMKREMKDGKQPKRKAADEEEPLEELAVSGIPSKKARVDEEEDEEDVDSDEEEDEDDDMEEWQREAAAQLAAEAEEEERARKEEEERKKMEEEEELRRKEKEKGMPSLNMPARVDLSLDEAKALFKVRIFILESINYYFSTIILQTLLREKQINPMLPWDTALPQFISDPRYVLLPSVAARRDAFDEYCRERVREMRAEKVKAEKASADGAGDAQVISYCYFANNDH